MYDIYGHLLPSADEAAAEKLNAVSRNKRATGRVVQMHQCQKLKPDRLFLVGVDGFEPPTSSL